MKYGVICKIKSEAIEHQGSRSIKRNSGKFFRQFRRNTHSQRRTDNNSANSENTESKSSIEGLKLSNLTNELKRQYNIQSDIKGVIITNVEKGSKAEDYGFERGDIIMQIAQKEIKTIADIDEAIKSNKGKKIVWVLRNEIPLGIVIK